MQKVKQGIKQMEGDSLEEKFSQFLHKYRITPHSTTEISPLELLMGKRLCSRLDLTYPDVSIQVEGKQWKQKCYNDKKQATRTFLNGDLVYYEDFSSVPEKWIPGIIEKVTGPASYQTRLGNGQIMQRHVDSVRAHFPAQANPVPIPEIPVQDSSVQDNFEEDTYKCVQSKHKQRSGNSETSSSGRNSESTARAPQTGSHFNTVYTTSNKDEEV